MARKRKTAAVDEEKENQTKLTEKASGSSGHAPPKNGGPIYTIFSHAQLSETLHKRYVSELRQLYTKMDHDAFMYTFVRMLKTVLEADDTSEYGNNALMFCAKFVSSNSKENRNTIVRATLAWVLSTISPSPHIRYRLCHFVNLLLNEMGPDATLDDEDCDQILQYMLARLSDVSASVRKQAVLAMQRLQLPDDREDPVVRAYLYHLSSDPSPNVRMCVISSMGRNFLTIPYILDRLSDIDEKVRRHMILNMSSYPVRTYKVSQRLWLLEQGLNDRSECVRKAVTQCMLKQWIESYNNNLIDLTGALKIDATPEEMQRFCKTAGQMLTVIFEQKPNLELVEQLSLGAEDAEFHRCVPFESLTVEVVIYWQQLSEYLRRVDADELDLVLPELSTFCAYCERYCESVVLPAGNDKFQQLEYQTILLSLLQILHNYDMADEVGRTNMQKLLTHLLKHCLLSDNVVEVVVRCLENLVPDVGSRFSYFREVINELCELQTNQNDLVHDRTFVARLLEHVEPDLRTKITALKLKILDLEEQEENYVSGRDYIKAQQANEERVKVTEEYMAYLQPLLVDSTNELELSRPKLTKEHILRGLQVIFFMVSSKKVQSLSPSICALYHDLICRHLASKDSNVRDWALRCGTAYAMIYEPLAKDVFDVLYTQFYKTNVIALWETSAKCIFELLSLYGAQKFSDTGADQAHEAKNSTTRVLYNAHDFGESEGDSEGPAVSKIGIDGVVMMMTHFLDTCENPAITRAIVSGFCRMILLGHLSNRRDILEKLLKLYFNPNTDTGVNQILGVFLEHIVEMKMQHILQPCFLPMLASVLTVNFDHPLHEVSPETVARFFIDMTRQQSGTPKTNLHNKIALSCLQEMLNTGKDRKDLCRIISKEMLTLNLNLNDNLQLKNELSSLADKIIKLDIEPRTTKNVLAFKQILNGELPSNVRRGNTTSLMDEDGETELTVLLEVDNDGDDCSIAVTSSNTHGADSVTNEQLSEDAGPTTFGKDNCTNVQHLRRSLNAPPSSIFTDTADEQESAAGSQQAADDATDTEPPPAKRPTPPRKTRRRGASNVSQTDQLTTTGRGERRKSKQAATSATRNQTQSDAQSEKTTELRSSTTADTSLPRVRSARIQARAASGKVKLPAKSKRAAERQQQHASKLAESEPNSSANATTTKAKATAGMRRASRAGTPPPTSSPPKRRGRKRKQNPGSPPMPQAVVMPLRKSQRRDPSAEITTGRLKRASLRKRCSACSCDSEPVVPASPQRRPRAEERKKTPTAAGKRARKPVQPAKRDSTTSGTDTPSPKRLKRNPMTANRKRPQKAC